MSSSILPSITITPKTIHPRIYCIKIEPINSYAPNKPISASIYRTSNPRCYFQRSIHDLVVALPYWKRRGVPLSAPCCMNNSESREEDDRVVETVLRLYSAIKSKDIQDLSGILCEECHCVSNFLSPFKPLQGKQQVLEFFSTIMASLGNNVEFIVQQTMDEGMNIGVSWKLECTKTHAPMGKGFSFHMCHVYHGKVVIRNVEMFMEPLVHIEPLRLRMMKIIVSVIETVGSYQVFMALLKAKRTACVFLALVLMAASMFFFKLFFFH